MNETFQQKEDELGFVVEKPDSSPAAPLYLSAENGTGQMRFFWTTEHIHALRFARAEDSELISAISKTHQPDLWQEVRDIGKPRVCQHAWSSVSFHSAHGEYVANPAQVPEK